MATVNNRVSNPQGSVINGLDAGGLMSANISEGYENILKSSPDGLQVPLKDREVQFCRGSVVTQDWPHAVALLTGTATTYIFYERKSGVAEATGFIKHTITAPIIHRMTLTFTKGGYATVSFDFECRAADPTKTIADMHAYLDSQAAPSYLPAALGGYRITSLLHGSQAIKHVMGLTVNITTQLVKACNDGDIANTCVDARLDGLTCDGSVTFQDAGITTNVMLAQTLVLAAKASLVATIVQGQAQTAKTLTIAGVVFDSVSSNSGAAAPFTEYTVNFDIANDLTTQLTLAGTNNVLTIA
jgi:hypothetical protein